MQKKSASIVLADWHPADIKAELNKKGLTLRALSLANNMHQDSLKNTLRMRYPRGERIIAAALGCEPEQIWPSRYVELNYKVRSPLKVINAVMIVD